MKKISDFCQRLCYYGDWNILWKAWTFGALFISLFGLGGTLTDAAILIASAHELPKKLV